MTGIHEKFFAFVAFDRTVLLSASDVVIQTPLLASLRRSFVIHFHRRNSPQARPGRGYFIRSGSFPLLHFTAHILHHHHHHHLDCLRRPVPITMLAIAQSLIILMPPAQ